MLNRFFALEAHGTTVRIELLAGFTTFLTMVYIVVVNPVILGDAGMPVGAVAVATCLAAGFGSILMGLVSNYPLALAPGMGLNAYFTYTVVKGMGVPWETALGCVFLSGTAFLVLTVVGVRQLIVGAIPRSLFAAVAGARWLRPSSQPAPAVSRMPSSIAPLTFQACRAPITSRPARDRAADGVARLPSPTDVAGLETMTPASFSPMKAMKSPMPPATAENSERGIAFTISWRAPTSVSTRKAAPEMKTHPSAVSHGTPMP